MIDYNTFIYDNNFFPIIVSNNFFNNDIYQKLKHDFPNYDNYIVSNNGQEHRKNIVVVKNSENYNRLKKHNPEFAKLFDTFNSKKFITSCSTYFENELKKNGFTGSLENSFVEMSICQSSDNYENPWHVDTRKRIIHALIYFGRDDIKSGGELAIAKHKLKNIDDYPRYPKQTDLLETKFFEPNDNLGIIILSTPNSYHKGCLTNGIRRFIYLSINNNNNKDAWVYNKNNFPKIPFNKALTQQ